jgi:hypothetical protein
MPTPFIYFVRNVLAGTSDLPIPTESLIGGPYSCGSRFTLTTLNASQVGRDAHNATMEPDDAQPAVLP